MDPNTTPHLAIHAAKYDAKSVCLRVSHAFGTHEWAAMASDMYATIATPHLDLTARLYGGYVLDVFWKAPKSHRTTDLQR